MAHTDAPLRMAERRFRRKAEMALSSLPRAASRRPGRSMRQTTPASSSATLPRRRSDISISRMSPARRSAGCPLSGNCCHRLRFERDDSVAKTRCGNGMCVAAVETMLICVRVSGNNPRPLRRPCSEQHALLEKQTGLPGVATPGEWVRLGFNATRRFWERDGRGVA